MAGIVLIGLVTVLMFIISCRLGTNIPKKYLGETAWTTISIPANGVGRIQAVLGGECYEVPACAVDGKAITYRHDVIIEDFRNGVAYVRPLEVTSTPSWPWQQPQ